MGSLEQNNRRYEQMKTGDALNSDESNKFFKRPQRGRDAPPLDRRPADPSLTSPAHASDDSVDSPAERLRVGTDCPLTKAMLEENKFKYQPSLAPHEGESVDREPEANWTAPDAFPSSPAYNKHDDSFKEGSDDNEVYRQVLGNASVAEKEGKLSGCNSPKLHAYQAISHGFRYNRFGPTANNFDIYDNPTILMLPLRHIGGTSDDLQKPSFKLNVINIDDQIAVPSVTSRGEAEMRGLLFSGATSEKNSKKEFK